MELSEEEQIRLLQEYENERNSILAKNRANQELQETGKLLLCLSLLRKKYLSRFFTMNFIYLSTHCIKMSYAVHVFFKTWLF